MKYMDLQCLNFLFLLPSAFWGINAGLPSNMLAWIWQIALHESGILLFPFTKFKLEQQT
jgi:hypothetical protein